MICVGSLENLYEYMFPECWPTAFKWFGVYFLCVCLGEYKNRHDGTLSELLESRDLNTDIDKLFQHLRVIRA